MRAASPHLWAETKTDLYIHRLRDDVRLGLRVHIRELCVVRALKCSLCVLTIYTAYFDTTLNKGVGVVRSFSFYVSPRLDTNGVIQNPTTQLTCALFGTPLTAANATNCGARQADGTMSISTSFGFTKPIATV